MNPPFYQINITDGKYLRVELPDLSLAYTFGRLFKISLSGRLETMENYPLKDYIFITPPYTSQLQFTLTGEVKELIAGVWTSIGQIIANSFINPEGLLDLGNGYFKPTPASGTPLIGIPGDPGDFENVKIFYQTVYDIQHFYPKAVMKVKPDDCSAVLELSRTVIAALTDNSAVYPSPDPPLADIDTQADLLESLIAEVEAGNRMKLELRNQASELLYRILQDETIYVNRIGNGDRGILELSGFSVSDPPDPKPVPPQVIIKRIEDGPHPNTIKIFIEPIRQHNLVFTVEATLTPDIPASWDEVLVNTSSHELEIPHRTRGQEVWYRIAAANANGAGLWSIPHSHISQH